MLEALGHAFFTLSLGMGAMLTYGSYIGRDISIPRAALQISFLDTLIALMACVIMFSIINTSDIEVAKSATILFTTIPTVLVKLPGGGLRQRPVLHPDRLRRPDQHHQPAGSGQQLRHRRTGLDPPPGHPDHGLGHHRLRRAQRPEPGRQRRRCSSINLIGRESTAGHVRHHGLPGQQLVPAGGRIPDRPVRAAGSLSAKTTREELEDGHGAMAGYRLLAFPDPLRRAPGRGRHHRQRHPGQGIPVGVGPRT